MFNSRLNPDVLRLASSQALAGANSTVIFATGAIIGHILAPSPALATVPVSIFVVGMAAATLPVGVVTRRYGRKTSALFGSVCGVTVGLLAALALVIQSFSLFCVAMLFGGAYAAVVLTYRFAAAECVPAEHRARAMSTVLAGGVAAGVLGPQLVTATMNLWSPHAYAVTYLAASAGTAVLSAIVLQGVRFEHQPPVSAHAHGRPSSDIMRQPRFVVAMLCGVVSYMMMNFMMTSAPLAMELCGIPRVHANYGIEIHVIAISAAQVAPLSFPPSPGALVPHPTGTSSGGPDSGAPPHLLRLASKYSCQAPARETSCLRCATCLASWATRCSTLTSRGSFPSSTNVFKRLASVRARPRSHARASPIVNLIVLPNRRDSKT